MNIFFLSWDGLHEEEMCTAFEEAGYTIIKIIYGGMEVMPGEVRQLLEENLSKTSCGFVFSFQYFPAASNACAELNIKYVSWVYDNANMEVYSRTVLNSCNYIFVFDFLMYEEFRKSGINTVYYLPLAVNTKQIPEKDADYDISVGGLLCLNKKHIYDEFDKLDSFTKGYLDGLIQAQKSVFGYDFLEEILTPQIVEKLENVYPMESMDTLLTPKSYYANQVLYPKITVLEQQETLKLLGGKYKITNDVSGEKVGQFKVNLNITARITKSGIPWRALEIMGNGGLLLSSYQQELLEYFEPDKDFVCYYGKDDLLEKIDYYLKHDDEREQIARNGFSKVKEEHTFQHRIKCIQDILF